MQMFTDSKGDKWTLDLTVGAVKRVLALAKVDLRKPTSPNPLAPPEEEPIALSAYLDLDTVLLGSVLYGMCYGTCEDRGLNEDQFFDRLGAETIQAAHDAFFVEWADFFRHSGSSPIAAILDKQVKFVKAAVARAEQEWDKAGVGAKLDAILGQEMDKIAETTQTAAEELNAMTTTDGDSSTTLPESVESTPTISASEDS